MNRKIILLCVVLTIAFFGYSQENTSGKVVYEQIIKMEIKLEGDASQFAHMLPKERKTNKILYFNPEISLYENYKDTEDEAVSMSSGNANVMIKMAEPENIVYTDLSEKKQLEQREFMTRNFLIESEVNHQWKITGKQKLILDYPCQEAVIEKDSILYSAWFTPAIPVSAGPGNYSGLPGLILAVESEDGSNIKQATSVDFEDLEKDILKKPKKGKKVSKAEFDQIVAEKMKEMGAQQGGHGATMMIRIQK